MAYLGVNDELWAVILPVCGNIMVYLHANFQPITHPIANVIANIRYRPAVAADQPTQARKFQKIPESKTFFWQIFTPANDSDYANYSVSQGKSQKIHQSPQL